jgi:predicted RNA-binding Zn-ribbon protein involved in translation (DUF1610 family)
MRRIPYNRYILIVYRAHEIIHPTGPTHNSNISVSSRRSGYLLQIHRPFQYAYCQISINLDALANTMEQKCPECGARFNLRRIEDLTVAEYKARCPKCGFSNSLKQMKCGGCHGLKFFRWTGKLWRCIQCGHIRRDASPPRT